MFKGCEDFSCIAFLQSSTNSRRNPPLYWNNRLHLLGGSFGPLHFAWRRCIPDLRIEQRNIEASGHCRSERFLIRHLAEASDLSLPHLTYAAISPEALFLLFLSLGRYTYRMAGFGCLDGIYGRSPVNSRGTEVKAKKGLVERGSCGLP